jgi:hypothetical protein
MPKPKGRPRKEFDLRQIKTFGSLGLTGEEMAALLKVDGATISHRMHAPDSEFLKAYQTGFSDLKKSLRRKQIAVALKGNCGMLIWLGKQLLDQHDTPTTAVSVTTHALPAQPTAAEFKERIIAAQEFTRKYLAEHDGQGQRRDLPSV